MIISVSGSGGLIGTALKRAFREKGWKVRPISRDSFGLTDEEFYRNVIEGSDVIINLAGANIAKKWTPACKKEIYDSRIKSTRRIAGAIHTGNIKPRLLISVSGIDIYDTIRYKLKDGVENGK